MTPAKDLIKTLKVGDRVRIDDRLEGEVRIRGRKKWIWIFWSLKGEGYDDWAQDAMNWPCKKIEPIIGQGKADKIPVPKAIRKQDRVGVCQSKGKEFPAEKNSPECCSGRPLKPKEIVLEGTIKDRGDREYLQIVTTDMDGYIDNFWVKREQARKLGLKDGEKVKIRIGKA